MGEHAFNQKTVDTVAVGVNKLLNPIDDAARRKVNGDAVNLLRGLAQPGEWQAESVENLENASNDRQRPQNQELARKRLELLATGIYIAGKYGDNKELTAALESGSADLINSLLPESLKGIGERVRNIEITNEDIRKILDQLDRKGRSLKVAGSAGKRKLVENLEAATVALSELEGLDEKGDEEMMRVSAYLGYEVDNLSEGEGSKTSSIEEALLKVTMAMNGGERSESTYDTFTTAEFLQQPIQLQVDTFPPSWFKNPPEWFSGTEADWQQIIRARINLTNASYVKQEVAAMDGEKAKNNNYLKLSERELGLLYELPGVRHSMETIVNDFFEANVDPESGAFFLKLSKQSIDRVSWKDRLASFKEYQNELIKKLVENGLEAINARAAVAIAWNFLYVSNVFESADEDREISGGSGNVFGEQIRAMMHPLSKAQRKFGVQPDLDADSRSQGTEEGWGGNVGAWFADMMTWDDTRPNFIRALQTGELRPYPERIGASMCELLKVKVGSQEMSMAQALLEQRKISFGKTDSNLFGDYGDKWDTFFKFYLYATGKNLLDIRKNIDDWSNSLADVLAKVRGIKVVGGEGRMFDKLDSVNAFAWIMLNSMGIERSSEIMLKIPEKTDYEGLVDMIIEKPRLMPGKDDRKELKKILHARLIDKLTRAKIIVSAMARNSRSK
ncbi:MAG TPA: hypothetical protein PK370_01135 [Candidatus Woesebacteria bacterium]|nr:hypothetical protein [Candidatus Woesebacteria bacterium]